MAISLVLLFIPFEGSITAEDLWTDIQGLDLEVADALNLPTSKNAFYQSILRLEKEEYIQSEFFEKKKKMRLTLKGLNMIKAIRKILFGRSDLQIDIRLYLEELKEELKQAIIDFFEKKL
jgi:DNA-binding PadR family transcriptional regulator